MSLKSKGFDSWDGDLAMSPSGYAETSGPGIRIRRITQSLGLQQSSYQEVAIVFTLARPDSTLMDIPAIVDLANMPELFWDLSKEDLGDVRVYVGGDGGEEAPQDLVYFDKNAQTGLLVFKIDELPHDSDTIVTIAVGNPEDEAYEHDDVYGSDNVYASKLHGFWPLGGGADRTSNSRDLTASGGTPPSPGAINVADYGLSASWKATAYNFGSTPTPVQTSRADFEFDPQPLTLLCTAYMEGVATADFLMSAQIAGDYVETSNMIAARGDVADDPTRANTGGITVAAVNGFVAETWYTIAGVFASTASRVIYRDGTTASGSFDVTANTSTCTRLLIGARGAPEAGSQLNGLLMFLAAYDVAVSTDELDYMQLMIKSNADFLGLGA